MGKVTALMAGEKCSPQEVLADALGECQDGKIKSVVVLMIDNDDVPDVSCSAIPVRDLAYLEKIFADFVGEVVRGSYLREGEAS